MNQSIWRIDKGELPGCPVGTVIALVQEGDSARVIREGVGQVGTLHASTTHQTSTPDGSSITLVNRTEGWRAVLSRTTAGTARPAAPFCIACGAVLSPMAQFCSTCGTRVSGGVAQAEEWTPSQAGPSPTEAGRVTPILAQPTRPRRIWLALGLVIVVAVAVAAWVIVLAASLGK